MNKTWRDSFRPLIARIIHEVGTDNMPKLRKALRYEFPIRPRKYYPYKIWLDEIQIQLGPTKAKKRAKKTRQEMLAAGQRELL